MSAGTGYETVSVPLPSSYEASAWTVAKTSWTEMGNWVSAPPLVARSIRTSPVPIWLVVAPWARKKEAGCPSLPGSNAARFSVPKPSPSGSQQSGKGAPDSTVGLGGVKPTLPVPPLEQ